MSSHDLAVDTARRTRRAVLLSLWGCLASAGDAHAVEKPAIHKVTIDAGQFAPPAVHAKVGDTVVWVNKDPFPHTVTAPGRFDSGTIQSGASWRFKLKAKGTFAYVCTLHPTMKASIVVK